VRRSSGLTIRVAYAGRSRAPDATSTGHGFVLLRERTSFSLVLSRCDGDRAAAADIDGAARGLGGGLMCRRSCTCIMWSCARGDAVNMAAGIEEEEANMAAREGASPCWVLISGVYACVFVCVCGLRGDQKTQTTTTKRVVIQAATQPRFCRRSRDNSRQLWLWKGRFRVPCHTGSLGELLCNQQYDVMKKRVRVWEEAERCPSLLASNNNSTCKLSSRNTVGESSAIGAAVRLKQTAENEQRQQHRLPFRRRKGQPQKGVCSSSRTTAT
jgi:hypothetical protein